MRPAKNEYVARRWVSRPESAIVRNENSRNRGCRAPGNEPEMTLDPYGSTTFTSVVTALEFSIEEMENVI